MSPFFDYTPDNNIYEAVFNDYTNFFIFSFFPLYSKLNNKGKFEHINKVLPFSQTDTSTTHCAESSAALFKKDEQSRILLLCLFSNPQREKHHQITEQAVPNLFYESWTRHQDKFFRKLRPEFALSHPHHYPLFLSTHYNFPSKDH